MFPQFFNLDEKQSYGTIHLSAICFILIPLWISFKILKLSATDEHLRFDRLFETLKTTSDKKLSDSPCRYLNCLCYWGTLSIINCSCYKIVFLKQYFILDSD